MPFRRRARPDGRVYCARPQDHMRVTERVADLERANSELRERGAALEGRVLELERQVPLSPTLVQPRFPRSALARAACKICMRGVVPGDDASAPTRARLERERVARGDGKL